MAASSVTLGPQNGTITVRTYRDGMAKRAGHDLALEVGNWSATAAVNRDDPAASDVEARLDLRSLEVREATGGVKPLSGGDHKDIAKNIEKTLNLSNYPEVTFSSHSIDGDGGHRLRLNGNLTLAGTTRPVSVDLNVERQDGTERLTGTVALTHSDFGLKPYSGLMGTLKVKDEVHIDVDVKLPQG